MLPADVSMTNPKKENRVSVQPTASPPNELNTFCACFDAAKKQPIICSCAGRKAAMLILEVVGVRRSFQRVSPHKAPRPDGILGCTLKTCMTSWWRCSPPSKTSP